MPKKFGINSKSEDARERVAGAKKEERARVEKAKEDAKWVETDKGVLSKESKRREEEEKRQAAAERKKQLAALAKKEEEELSKLYTKPKDTKMTRAEVVKQREEEELKAKREKEKEKQKAEKEEDEIQPNLNRMLSEQQAEEDAGLAIHARSVDEAIEKLSIASGSGSSTTTSSSSEVDKHPEKRMKAAFKAYEDRELPGLRQEYPGLKLSQLKEILWKQWQKSPENPVVAAHLAQSSQ